MTTLSRNLIKNSPPTSQVSKIQSSENYYSVVETDASAWAPEYYNGLCKWPLKSSGGASRDGLMLNWLSSPWDGAVSLVSFWFEALDLLSKDQKIKRVKKKHKTWYPFQV